MDTGCFFNTKAYMHECENHVVRNGEVELCGEPDARNTWEFEVNGKKIKLFYCYECYVAAEENAPQRILPSR